MFGLLHLTLADKVQDHFLSLAPKQKQNKKPTTTTIINNKKKQNKMHTHKKSKQKIKQKKKTQKLYRWSQSFLPLCFDCFKKYTKHSRGARVSQKREWCLYLSLQKLSNQRVQQEKKQKSSGPGYLPPFEKYKGYSKQE